MIRWLFSRTIREVCAARKHYARLLAAQRDILAPAAVAGVQVKLDELSAALASGANKGKLRLQAEELQFAAEKWLKRYPHAVWRENVEVLLVALAVAMGIRTFFLQPFKIPTGSMQPTLFGVTAKPNYTQLWEAIRMGQEDRAKSEFEKDSQIQKDLVIPTGWQRVMEWFQGNSYIHFVAPTDGAVESVGPVTRFLIFNIKQSFVFAGEEHTLWFPPDFGEAPGNLTPLVYRAGLLHGRVFHKGDDVIKLRMTTGDHLFVDRLTYNFRKPNRGDTIVFETAGIPQEMRERWGIPEDEFYIKRLVGLPGERVQIGDDRHLRINGQRLDAGTPHFENVYGFDPKLPPRESEWSGHVNGTVAQEYKMNNLGGVPFFPDENTTYDVPSDSCLPMGDNTCNSLDSRFWGAIPEKYVIGKSFFVYWPITTRFGWGNQ
jgi:signal peptidase I